MVCSSPGGENDGRAIGGAGYPGRQRGTVLCDDVMTGDDVGGASHAERLPKSGDRSPTALDRT
jgi:hypothetical protein